MKFQVSRYRNGKADLIRSIKQHGVGSISLYCACVGFPVAAACVFVKEEYPEQTEAMDRILAVLKEFYDYEDIIE